MNAIHRTGKRNDLLYDVGMHRGEDTDYYLRKGFDVLGFEADPDLAAHCRRRFSEEIQTGRLTIVEGAIVECLPGKIRPETVKFYRNKGNTVWGTIAPDWARRNEILGTSNEVLNCPVVDFAECLQKYGIPHFLKIDIEGMDTVCLRALLHFEQKPDYVSIESEKGSFVKLVKELKLLTDLGYTRFKAIQQNGISKQAEPYSSREGRYVGYQFAEGSSGVFGEDLPGEWKTVEQIVSKYRTIFPLHRLFGDDGILSGFFLGRTLGRFLSKLLRRPIPGWYDTHAKHHSIVDRDRLNK